MLHGIRSILVILMFVLFTLGMNINARAQQTPMTITYEQTISGSLDTTDPALSDGSHHSDEYIFQAEAGKSYQITVKSDAFAAEVYVYFSNAPDILQGAYVIRPGDQVQFSGTLEQSGQHTIKVTTSSWEPSALGHYTLTLSEGQPPGPPPSPSLTDETVQLNVFQNYPIPSGSITFNSILAESFGTTDQTSTTLPFLIGRGEMIFISMNDNPFLAAYVSDSDVQNHTPAITLDTVTDGLFLLNPMMFQFTSDDRLLILNFVKHHPSYPNLRQLVDTTLRSDPLNLLVGPNPVQLSAPFTQIVTTILQELGVDPSSERTLRAIIGKTDVPHLNTLGQSAIEIINPTLIFYGFEVEGRPDYSHVIPGKDNAWQLVGFDQFGPFPRPKFEPTEPVKEQIDLGSKGQFVLNFYKSGSTLAGHQGAAANAGKIVCHALNYVSYGLLCTATNATIASSINKQPLERLTSLVIDDRLEHITDFSKLFDAVSALLSDPGRFTVFLEVISGHTLDANNVKIIQQKAVGGLLKVASKVLFFYELSPFLWDGALKPVRVSYCITLTGDNATEGCVDEPPPDPPPPPTQPPGSGIPVITHVDFPDSIIGNEQYVDGEVYFTDSDAGINLIHWEIVSTNCNDCDFNFSDFDPEVSHLTEGSFGFGINCTATEDFHVELLITLRDVDGNESEPYYFGYDCVRPGDVIVRSPIRGLNVGNKTGN